MCFVRLFLVLYVDHGDTTEVMEVALSLGGVFWGVGAVKQTLPHQVLCQCEASAFEQACALAGLTATVEEQLSVLWHLGGSLLCMPSD